MTTPTNFQTQNKILSLITFITSIGDFISFFAIIVLLHNLSGSLLVAAYAVPIKSLGVVAAGLLLPYCSRQFRPKKLLFWTQIISALLLFSVVLMVSTDNFHSWYFLFVLFSLSCLKQLFDAAREIESKALGSTQEQRGLQAQLLSGFYNAQLIGPIISFFLIRYFSISVPILVDGVSFVVAAIASCFLLDLEQPQRVSSTIFKPFSYFSLYPGLRLIFLLRSVGYWFPIGIANYLLFVIVEEQYHLKLENSAWVYSIIGLGSLVATTLLAMKKSTVFSATKLTDGKLAFWALLLLGIFRIGFAFSPSFLIASIFIFAGGICNGTNAVATQSLRRKLTDHSQFPEVVGLEIVVGRFVDWLSGTLTGLALTAGLIDFKVGILVSSFLLLGLASFHLSKKLSL